METCLRFTPVIKNIDNRELLECDENLRCECGDAAE